MLCDLLIILFTFVFALLHVELLFEENWRKGFILELFIIFFVFILVVIGFSIFLEDNFLDVDNLL